ncbi:MAG: DUF3084 domain-containing protein [Candidatus Sericytochromatia bacterium]
MKPAVWVALLFVLASGLSAWIGNEWGRKIGKRKLSVFSLRPKHTSTVLTIVLSMALSLGMLGSLLVLSPNLRDALLQPEKRDAAELERYQAQQADVSATLQRLQQRPAASARSAETTRVAAAVPSPAPSAALDSPPSPPVATAAPVRTALRPAAPKTAPTAAPAAQQKTRPTAEPTARPSLAPSAEQLALAPRDTQAGGRLEASPARGTWQPERTPRSIEVAMVDTPIFALQVYGGRSNQEQRQIQQGLIELARGYAQTLGVTPAGNQWVRIPDSDFVSLQQALENRQLLEIQVRVGATEVASEPLPMRIVAQKVSAPETAFDPHTLLESARLNPDSPQDSLRSDLQLAMQNLVQDTRPAFEWAVAAPPENTALAPLATARLPLEIVQLRRSGDTLQGLILLPLDASNLTQN